MARHACGMLGPEFSEKIHSRKPTSATEATVGATFAAPSDGTLMCTSPAADKQLDDAARSAIPPKCRNRLTALQPFDTRALPQTNLLLPKVAA